MQRIVLVVQVLITLLGIQRVNYLVTRRPLRLDRPNGLLVVGSQELPVRG